MDSTAAKPQLPSEHDERIAAIRERVQRHVQRSARLFATPPLEETDNNLLPVPSLLAVACTAALANQAQATPVSNEEEINRVFYYSNGVSVSLDNGAIELANNITLHNDLKKIPYTAGGRQVYKSTSIDGQGHEINGNSHRIFEGIDGTTLKK